MPRAPRPAPESPTSRPASSRSAAKPAPGRAARGAKPNAAPTVTRALLRRMPLPELDAAGDKESRGRVLVVGGSATVPGAVLLAGVAALRAGAGKLQMGTVDSAAGGVALAVPEALVAPLPRTPDGEIAGAGAAEALGRYASGAQAVLVGPGMSDVGEAGALLTALVSRLGDGATLVLDGAAAIALKDCRDALRPLVGRAVLTPHAGEMAALLGVEADAVRRDPPGIARATAARLGAVIALKGAESWIAAPDGALFHYTGGNVGLGTSGSGDTLAGVVAGLAARGAEAATAAVWGVWAHGAAGEVLSRRMGPVGFLARELLDEIPMLIAKP